MSMFQCSMFLYNGQLLPNTQVHMYVNMRSRACWRTTIFLLYHTQGWNKPRLQSLGVVSARPVLLKTREMRFTAHAHTPKHPTSSSCHVWRTRLWRKDMSCKTLWFARERKLAHEDYKAANSRYACRECAVNAHRARRITRTS